MNGSIKLARFRQDNWHHLTGETKRRFALEEPAVPPLGDRPGHPWEAGFRALAADLLCGIRRTAPQTRHYQSNGRVSNFTLGSAVQGGMMRQIACLLSLAMVASAADLPVREVVLFKHGVGYFARFGHLSAGESARLDFKAGEMNDVLKSLTIEQKGVSKISGLRYDSSEPLAKKLEEFPFSIGSQQPLRAVLDQLKGARVELKFGAETVAGAIVGARRQAGG